MNARREHATCEALELRPTDLATVIQALECFISVRNRSMGEPALPEEYEPLYAARTLLARLKREAGRV
jgi:hypothetical protein